MAFRFESNEGLKDGIERMVIERLNRITHSLSEKPHPSDEQIHNARKDLKSLRAILRLIRGSIPAEKRRFENGVFRDIARALGKNRDATVLVETFSLLLESEKRSRHSTKAESIQFAIWLRDQCNLGSDHPIPDASPLIKQIIAAKQRVPFWLEHRPIAPDQTGLESPDQINPADSNDSSLNRIVATPAQNSIRNTTTHSVLSLPSIHSQKDFGWKSFIGTGLRQTYRQGYHLLMLIDTVGPQHVSEETWHGLRKYSKALGYQLRTIRPTWLKPMESLIGSIDEMTELLGQDHDLYLVQERCKMANPLNHPLNTKSMRDRFLAKLKRRRTHKKKEALKVARRIFAEKPRHFERRLSTYWNVWRQA
jgi:CHAD domain-containing protein